MFGISSTLEDVLQLLPRLRTLCVWPVEVPYVLNEPSVSGHFITSLP